MCRVPGDTAVQNLKGEFNCSVTFATTDPWGVGGGECLQVKIWKVKKLKMGNFRHNFWFQGVGEGSVCS